MEQKHNSNGGGLDESRENHCLDRLVCHDGRPAEWLHQREFHRGRSGFAGESLGIVSLVDLYVGFTLFSMWIAFREKNKVLMAGWIVAMMVFGFFAGSLYVLVAFYQSKGDWLNFFLGSRKTDVLGK